MRTDANWCARMGSFLLVLMLVLAVVSCNSGGGGVASLNPTDNNSDIRNGSADRSVGQLEVSEGEIAKLPAWQQEMLSDPGWNAPYIPPAEGTAVEAPTNELLKQEIAKALERGNNFAYRGLDTADTGRSVSWDDQGSFDGVSNVGKGEYETLAPGGTPSFGCNNSGANSSNGHAVEDIIVNTNMVIPQRVSFVLEGLSSPNYFNRTGGLSNSSLAAVYQLFSTDRGSDPGDADPLGDGGAEFAELSYRSDLAPGVGPGGDCSAAEAFSVGGNIWFRFNSITNALPGLNETALYNFLIAPSGAVSGEEVSSKITTGRWQPFYFGTVSPCFGGGAIVSLESSDSACEDDWNALFTNPDSQYFFTNPIYGVLLSRWSQSQITGMNGPWESEFGWPVFGPIVYGNGSQFLSVLGTYYVFGMWFEGGFCWWVDYDQQLYPGSSDEAQAFRYTGTHVYCTDGTYEPIGTPILYGGSGDLGVSVVVDSYRLDGASPWVPVPLSDDGTYYTIPLPADDGLATVNVAAHAHGFGGNPNDECVYKYYVWAWRDGSITAASSAYDTAQQYRTHTYGSLARNMENNYVIRVQVTDASFDLGLSLVEERAYGDALPLHIGHGGGGGGGEILVIRDDGGNYQTNYDALLADLDEIGAAYTAMDYAPGMDATFASEGDPYKAAIWYRGGPGDNAETQTFNDPWVGAKETELWGIVNNGGTGAGLLLMSQEHGVNNPFNTGGINSGWTTYTNFALLGAGAASDPGWSTNEGQPSGFYYPFFPFLANANHVRGQGTHLGGEFNTYSVNSAERHDSNGGSGKVPITFSFGNNRQMTVNASALNIPGISPTYTGGICLPTTFGIGQLTYGNSAAPGTGGGGPGKYWSYGQSWSETQVTLSNAGGPGNMSRGELLQNIMSWLDDTLTFGGGGGGGGGGNFSEYVGPPEIVQVTPISWAGVDGQITPGAVALTGVTYPDPTGTDIYRSAANSGNENYIVRTAGPSEAGLNANDVDFQFKRYTYFHDPDDSMRLFSGAGPGGSNLTGDETFMGWGGLLVDQGAHSGFGGGAGTQWKRVDSSSGNYTDWDTNVNGAGGTDFEDVLGLTILTPFAGYWTTTDEVIDSNADITDDVADSKVTANYGTQPSHLVYVSADEPLTFEAVAHWDSADANIFGQINWSLYPGHSTYDINTLDEYGVDISWLNFIHDTDIDPTHPNPGGLPYNRDGWGFLQHGFTYSELLAEGRIVSEFDYAAILGWHGDHDGDFELGEPVDDKFPVRARLITDIAAYDDWWNNFAGGPTNTTFPYPNHWPDASDPTTQTGGTFTEGGCYITDNTGAGFGGPPSIIPVEAPVAVAPGWNIRWTGTYPAAPAWQMDVTFTIDVGVILPAIVSLDLNADLPVDATNFDADVAVGGFVSGTYTQTVNFTSAQVSGGWANGDLNLLGARAANPLGESFANYTIPIWLGDVIRYDNFENMEISLNIGPAPNPGPNPALNSVYHNPGGVAGPNRIASVTGAGATIPTAPPLGMQSFVNSYWTARRGNVNALATNSRTLARAQRTIAGGGPARSWIVEHANMGNQAIYFDNASIAPFTYENNVFAPIMPPQSIVPSNNDIFLHVRSSIIGETSFDYHAFTTAIWNSLAGNNFGLVFADAVSGTFPTAIVRSKNVSQMANSVAWQWKNPVTNQVRMGMLFRSDSSVIWSPGGMMVDNLMMTHASTSPPYI